MVWRLRPLNSWPSLAPIVISLLATLLSTFAVTGISFVLLDLREQLGISPMQVNLLRCTAISSGLLIVFCAGSLCRRFGSRGCLSLSLLLWIAGSLLLAIHAGVLALALGLVLMGCADAGVRVSSYGMLLGGAEDDGQVASLVSANTLATSLAFVGSPIINSWILVRIDHGATVVGLFWAIMFGLALFLLRLLVRPDPLPAAGPELQASTIPWMGLLAAGGFATLISTLPILYAFNAGWVPAAIALAAGFALVTARAWRRSSVIAAGFRFLGVRCLLLLLIALALLFSMDYRYCAERFLAIRYQLDLADISAWMTPASLAAILASFGCAFAIPRFGMGRTLVIGILGCLILPISFVLAPVQVPIALIAAVTASFAFSLTIVRVGLTSMVTAMTAKPLLANLEAVRHVLATSAWSLGSALALNVLTAGFRKSLGEQLLPLALPDVLSETITRMVASGHGRQVLQNGYGIPRDQLTNILGKNAAPTLEAIMSVLHGMGWMILIMLILVTILIILSRSVAAPVARP
jgi:MFS family permease